MLHSSFHREHKVKKINYTQRKWTGRFIQELIHLPSTQILDVHTPKGYLTEKMWRHKCYVNSAQFYLLNTYKQPTQLLLGFLLPFNSSHPTKHCLNSFRADLTSFGRLWGVCARFTISVLPVVGCLHFRGIVTPFSMSSKLEVPSGIKSMWMCTSFSGNSRQQNYCLRMFQIHN